VTVEIYDEYSNLVDVPQNILLSIEGQSNFIFSTYEALSVSSYSADYTIPTNSDTVSNCGWYTLSNLLL
jgi:hypothetical protein